MTNKKRTRLIDTTHAPWNQQLNALGAVKHPSPKEILDYIKNELITTLETGDELDCDWDEIRSYHLRASLKLSTGSIPEICWAFFKLGEVHERLQHPTRFELSETLDNYKDDLPRLMTLELAEMKRLQPLKHKNYAKEMVKETAQEIADKLWKEDIGERILLTEMTKAVHPKLLADIERGIANHVDLINDGDIACALRNATPNKPENLKPWLREIAPGYASKQGRPKKKS